MKTRQETRAFISIGPDGMNIEFLTDDEIVKALANELLEYRKRYGGDSTLAEYREKYGSLGRDVDE